MEYTQDLFGNQITQSPETVVSTVTSKSPVNMFVLSDALFAGDKKNIWKTYHQLISQGVNVDELIPIIWWGLKSILLVRAGITTEVKPFVIKKIKTLNTKYSDEAIVRIANSFVSVVAALRTGRTSEFGIEGWILSEFV